MTFYYFILFTGIVLLISFVILRAKRTSPAITLLKSLVSVFFLLTLFAAEFTEGCQHFPFAACIGAGLLLGLLGDVWLDLKYVYPQDSDNWTYMGFSVFMVGHLFYIAAVIMQAGFSPAAVLIALIGAVGAILFVILGERPMKLYYGKFKWISATYAALLFFEMVFILCNAVISQDRGLLVMGIGSLVFLLSDLILSGTYFGEGKDGPVYIVSNHILYYIGQYMIASCVLWIGG